MKANLKLEFVGADLYDMLKGFSRMLDFSAGKDMRRKTMGDELPPKPWVAQITGRDNVYGLKRDFLRANRDYSESNKKGSRGVFLHFILEQGAFYEVQDITIKKEGRRFFCWVNDAGDIVKTDKTMVEKWLNESSE